MRNVLVATAFVVFVVGVLYFNSQKGNVNFSVIDNITPISSQNPNVPGDAEAVKVIAENLDTPWGIAFLPDGNMLVTERLGRVLFVGSDGAAKPVLVSEFGSAREIGEGGLLGITLHPDFSSNSFVYVYYTYSGSGDDTLNRVARMVYKDSKLSDEKIIVDGIPGARNHNGGRIKFGPDGFLYIATGDAQEPSRAQDTNSLAGKILRTTDEGKSPSGNPFNNKAYSYGHRNVQGLAWDREGKLWATEHGRSGLQSGLDELNLIEIGKNYGWPEIQGNESRAGMETPRRNSGSTTWAPAGAAFVGGSLFFGGLRGQTLYEATVSDNRVGEVLEHFRGQYGRIREVIAGPDGMLYITTSNRDGRGKVQSTDDKIIRVNPQKL